MTHVVSFSEIDTFRQCELKHLLAYKERWVSKEVSAPLAKGSLWHSVMEAHYRAIKDGLTEEEIMGAAYAALDQNAPDEEIRDLVHFMYQGHLEMWGYDRQWEIVAVEHSFEVWLPTDRGTRSGFKLKAKIDLVVKDAEGRIWVVDHKSGARLPYAKDYDLMEQFGLYTWGLRELGTPAFGQLYNAARTQRNKGPMTLEERFSRAMMFRTDYELDQLAIGAWRAAKRAYQIKPDEASRSMDPDRCGWRCNFTEPCLWGLKKEGGTREMLVDRGFVQDFSRH